MQPSETNAIKLGRRTEVINGVSKELWHIISPEVAKRLSPALWKNFLVYLKNGFTNRLNWELYKDMPVYEYQCTSEELKNIIKSFFESRNYKLKISFELFNYSPDFIPGDIPDTHQYHLSL